MIANVGSLDENVHNNYNNMHVFVSMFSLNATQYAWFRLQTICDCLCKNQPSSRGEVIMLE